MQSQSPEAAQWSEATYQELFRGESPRLVLVSEREKKIVGFLVARFGEDEVELENLVVAPSERRKGIAAELVTSLIADARERSMRKMFLEVRQANMAARCLYERCGFALYGTRKSYYGDPVEDALAFVFKFES